VDREREGRRRRRESVRGCGAVELWSCGVSEAVREEPAPIHSSVAVLDFRSSLA
jgi:hypothetical protein